MVFLAENEQMIGEMKLWTEYIFLYSQSVFGLKTREDHISKRKHGLNVRIVALKIYMYLKCSEDGKRPGKHSVEFPLPCSTSYGQSVYLLS